MWIWSDKSCDVGEYLDDTNCKYRKKLVDQLVEECTEIIDEVKSAGAALFESENKRKSLCTIYVALIARVFTIIIRFVTYFIYYSYMNHDKKMCF